MEDLLNNLAQKLFDNAGFENVRKTRQIIIWTVVIIALIVVIRLLLRSNISGLTKTTAKSTGFNFHDITEDIHAIDYDTRIREALSDNNFRLAIRWHYLELLHKMDKNHVISFASHKTYLDYRYEIKSPEMLKVFNSVSRIYDYVWYGQFVINQAYYSNSADEFLALKKKLHA